MSKTHDLPHIGQLLDDQILLLRLTDDILDQIVRIAERAAHHAAHGVVVLPQDTDHLDLQPILIERFQSQLFFAQVDISSVVSSVSAFISACMSSAIVSVDFNPSA